MRGYSREAPATPVIEACPACGGELVVREKATRFEPTYVSRVSLDLLNTPALEAGRPDTT